MNTNYTTPDQAAFIRLLDKGKIFSNRDLSNIEWQDIRAEDLEFENCFFHEVDFSGTELVRCTLNNCIFIRGRFFNANLGHSRFISCNFYDSDQGMGCDFSYAHLEECTFEDSNITLSKFERAELYGIRIKKCRVLGAIFRYANFPRILSNTIRLNDTEILDSDLSDADFEGCYLAEANFSGSKLNRVNFYRTNLTDTDLSWCELFNVDWEDAVIEGADLRQSSFNNIDIRATSVKGLKISVDQQPMLLEVLGVEIE